MLVSLHSCYAVREEEGPDQHMQYSSRETFLSLIEVQLV